MEDKGKFEWEKKQRSFGVKGPNAQYEVKAKAHKKTGIKKLRPRNLGGVSKKWEDKPGRRAGPGEQKNVGG